MNLKRDFRDIAYFTKHVKNEDLRCSLLEQLGYTIKKCVLTKNSHVNLVTQGRRGEYIIQVTEKLPLVPLAKCVVIELKKAKNKA